MGKNGNKLWSSHHKDLVLSNEAEYLLYLIEKYHDYFSKQDKKYRKTVKVLKILVLAMAMISTVVFGLGNLIAAEHQILVGLFLSALIAFITSMSAYFNYEEYWMRNISIHIELNIIRDNFIFDVKAGKLDSEKTINYRNQLDAIQHKNIQYWEKALKKI